jgi:hypothetical protein
MHRVKVRSGRSAVSLGAFDWIVLKELFRISNVKVGVHSLIFDRRGSLAWRGGLEALAVREGYLKKVCFLTSNHVLKFNSQTSFNLIEIRLLHSLGLIKFAINILMSISCLLLKYTVFNPVAPDKRRNC